MAIIHFETVVHEQKAYLCRRLQAPLGTSRLEKR
jgi:hypothetical protein